MTSSIPPCSEGIFGLKGVVLHTILKSEHQVPTVGTTPGASVKAVRLRVSRVIIAGVPCSCSCSPKSSRHQQTPGEQEEQQEWGQNSHRCRCVKTIYNLYLN